MSVLSDAIQKAKQFLGLRQQAYVQTFSKDDLFNQRVLQDLAKFCRAHETTFNPDSRLHAVLEGRREVFLRIVQHLKLTQDELWALHGRKDIQ